MFDGGFVVCGMHQKPTKYLNELQFQLMPDMANIFVVISLGLWLHISIFHMPPI